MLARNLILAACAAGLLAGGCALKSREPTFEAIDADGDGTIIHQEMHEYYYGRVFRLFDADRNGSITHAEWARRETGDDAEEVFQGLDADADGALTWEEFTTPAERRATSKNLLRTMDRDGDGKLRRAELED